MPLRAVNRTVSPSSTSRLRRSDSLRSVSSGSARSDDSLPRSPANGGPNHNGNSHKGKSVSFNNNVRVQYPRRTSHSFSKFDSLTSLNGRHSPVSNGINEIDYSNTNANGRGIPYASSPHHLPPQPQSLTSQTNGHQQTKNGGKKFWSNVWRSHSTRRPEENSSPVIKYKVKHSSPLVSRKLAGKKQAGSESPQVRRNHVKKIVNLFNRQAAVDKQKLKEDQETTGPKKGLHDLQSAPMPVPSMTLSRSAVTRSNSPPPRPSASPPAPPGNPKSTTSTTMTHHGPTTIKRTVTTTTYEPRSYEHVSFNNPLNLHSVSPHTDSSVNTSDKENSSFQSGSSFLNRDSGISLPASPMRSTSPGPFISTVTLNHSPRTARGARDPPLTSVGQRNSREFRHEFRSVPPYEDGGHFGGQSSDDSLYSDSGPPQRPLRSKPPSALNIPPPPQMHYPPPPMKDAAVQVNQVKPGNLTPVEEFPSRIYAPLYSQVNKALKKTHSSPPPPPPPPTSSMPPARWPSHSQLMTSSASPRWSSGHDIRDHVASNRDSRSQSPQWRHYRPGSPSRYGDHSLPTHLGPGDEHFRMSSPVHSQPVSRYSDLEHGATHYSDFGLSDAESAASRSRTPQSHVKTSSRSFGFNIGTKKKVKSKKTKAAQESDSSSTSSQGGLPAERSQSMLRASSAPKSLSNPTGSRTQRYNSLLDLSPAYNRSHYPTYEDEYGPTPKPPHTYSWSLSLGRAPKSKRSVDGGSTATGPIYSTQAPVAQAPRKAYSDAPSSVDEDHPSICGPQGPRRGGLAAAFHHRNTRAETFNSGASSCGSVAASEAAGVREPIVMYIPGVQRGRAPPDAAVNRSNSFLQQQPPPPHGRSNSPHHNGPQHGSSATLGRKEHKSRFAKQETKSGTSKNDRYKKDKERELDRHTAVQRSKSIPRNARFL